MMPKTSAPLAPLTLVTPGSLGLNKQLANSILDGNWATIATNAVFDAYGRLGARNGWDSITVTPIGSTPDIEQLFEYKQLDGDTFIISAAGNALYNGTSAPAAITGALTITANNWKFVNYNGNMYGLQSSHPLIQWTGSGNATATVAATGAVPDGNELLSAFGRLWGTSADGQTVKWSGLLDATYWTGTGAGSINLTSVWPNSADKVIALAAFNAFLVIFGERNIIVLADGSGSSIGLDPANIYVIDTIPGIGCIARDSVQNINGDDLVFLSSNGIHSLRRVIEDRSSPLRNLSANNHDDVISLISQETMSKVRSTYNPTEGFYLLMFPTANRILCFDTTANLPDNTWRTTDWDSFIPKSLLTKHDNATTLSGKVGKVFDYTGKLDNEASFNFKFETGWLLLSDVIKDRAKILKRLSAILSLYGTMTVTFKWYFDFSDTLHSVSRTIVAPASGAEYGLGEFGLGEFGGSYTTSEQEVPGEGYGQFIKLGVHATINDADISLQQLQMFTKIGRLT